MLEKIKNNGHNDHVKSKISQQSDDLYWYRNDINSRGHSLDKAIITKILFSGHVFARQLVRKNHGNTNSFDMDETNSSSS